MVTHSERTTQPEPEPLLVYKATRESDRLLTAHDAGSSEAELQQLAADGLGEAYFRDNGNRADGLRMEFTDIDYVETDL